MARQAVAKRSGRAVDGEEVQRGHGQQPAEKAAREEKRDYVGGVVGFQPVPDIEADGGGRG